MRWNAPRFRSWGGCFPARSFLSFSWILHHPFPPFAKPWRSCDRRIAVLPFLDISGIPGAHSWHNAAQLPPWGPRSFSWPGSSGNCRLQPELWTCCAVSGLFCPSRRGRLLGPSLSFYCRSYTADAPAISLPYTSVYTSQAANTSSKTAKSWY